MGLPHDFSLPEPPDGADEATRDAITAWGQIARLFLSQQNRREEIAEQLGLHFSDLISLFHMDASGGVSQRDLAEHWACDPSWVTNRIDRLEQLDLVERRLSPTDRRVKEVWLTPKGHETRAAGMAGFGRPPDALTGLAPADLHELARVLGTLDLPDPTQVPTSADR